MSAEQDAAAVTRVLEGDVESFAEIVDRWQSPLVNLAYRFCHDRGRAEDMAQEALIRAFRRLSTWRREGAFSTWLFALATNVYRTEVRRIPPRFAPLDEIAERAEMPAAAFEADDEARKQTVRQALDSLPMRYREALLLFYFHGLDVAAVASSLGVPEGTVKARLSRGRDLLRRKLGARHGIR